jgi:hypothetical protein
MAECVRLYNNGSYQSESRETLADIANWLEYNRTFRPGTALFVNEKCVEAGLYISKERCLEFEKKLQRRTR